jgi:arginine-tRNA-protein transferase
MTYNARMRSDRVRLFQTLPHTCGYYADRVSQHLVIDPAAPQLDKLYPQALAHGFRRSGDHLYRPRCAGCQACTPFRLAVARFRPNRSQRRCKVRNADLEAVETDAGYSEERHALYRRYLDARHRGGGMDGDDAEDFLRFLVGPWGNTRFLELRLHGDLLGVAATDVCPESLSAVYTFFDPAHTSRGLGTFAILSQIEWAQRLAVPHLYLGYWIAGHPKMDYKRRFQPAEVLGEHGWEPMKPSSSS